MDAGSAGNTSELASCRKLGQDFAREEAKRKRAVFFLTRELT
jgi:hypothetical protein